MKVNRNDVNGNNLQINKFLEPPLSFFEICDKLLRLSMESEISGNCFGNSPEGHRDDVND